MLQPANTLLKIPDRRDYDEYFGIEIKNVLEDGLITMYQKSYDRARATKTKYIKLMKAKK
ncbi:hypothetical protein A4R26_29275 [Niastella populi]|uniref:Uncharacterized protein n=1 Tax=Niastella populi TaxID=550983 RepID=A0A1V9F0U0_9BACT|nr:hypothetical protein A4R26_29275 [Niastella populi]